MNTLLALAVLPLAALSQTLTNETVLGVYMFHRHGDRTAKLTPPANLTGLGYREVVTSGNYYRNRYIASNATFRISGISNDIVKESQIQVSAPLDTVLQNSAMGFLQGLYPPVGSPLDISMLRNGTNVTAPMGGYQLIPVELSSSGAGSENSAWLQGTSNCAKAEISSNNYFSSEEYLNLLPKTMDFYQNLLPLINGTFNTTTNTFMNAYTIFDLINVAEIHNITFDPTNMITNETFFQLRTLADTHEWGLAFNKSEPIRAVGGATLAAQAVQFLNATIASAGKGSTIGIQFGAYNSFSSFFGLADLIALGEDFFGVADYASSMVFEMFTNTSSQGPFTADNYPTTDEIFVRFLFHNGTASEISEPDVFPLFGQDSPMLSWSDFVDGMNRFAIGNTQDWCSACGNTTGICAPSALGISGPDDSGSSSGGANGCSNGISPAVNGVIGAMVTLAVVLGIEALIMLIGGYRLVSKKALAQRGVGSSVSSSSAGQNGGKA